MATYMQYVDLHAFPRNRADYLSQLALLRHSADRTDYRTLMGLKSGTGAKVLGWQVIIKIDNVAPTAILKNT